MLAMLSMTNLQTYQYMRHMISLFGMLTTSAAFVDDNGRYKNTTRLNNPLPSLKLSRDQCSLQNCAD